MVCSIRGLLRIIAVTREAPQARGFLAVLTAAALVWASWVLGFATAEVLGSGWKLLGCLEVARNISLSGCEELAGISKLGIMIPAGQSNGCGREAGSLERPGASGMEGREAFIGCLEPRPEEARGLLRVWNCFRETRVG